MNIPSIFVWTHDSIGLGEDGPTHQPVEHLASLRAIPNLALVRPADANEVSVAWHEILTRHGGPTGIALTRQNVPVFARSSGDAHGDLCASAEGVRRGAYVLADSPTNDLDVILIATGSEVQLALEARDQLSAEGIGARVVSVPCVEWFAEQPAEYRESVLPSKVTARVSVEAGIALGWREWVGDRGRSVSIEQFGASADAATMFTQYGITANAVVDAAKESLAS
jgi:transketolase